jgi:hypothetical protein
LQRLLNGRQQRTFDAYGVVVARWQPLRRIEVVDDIDPADESNRPVDHGQLAVQTTQAMATQQETRDFRAVDHRLNPGADEHRLQSIGKARGAEAVHEHAHDDPAPSRVGQGFGDRTAGVVILEDVALDMDFALRLADCPDQRRKVVGATVQQRQPVSGKKFRRHPPAPLANGDDQGFACAGALSVCRGAYF